MIIKYLSSFRGFEAFSRLSVSAILILASSLASAGDPSSKKNVTFAEQIQSVFEYGDDHETDTLGESEAEEPFSSLFKKMRLSAARDPEFQEMIRNKPKGSYTPDQRRSYAVWANINQDAAVGEELFYKEQTSSDLESKKLFHSIELDKAKKAYSSTALILTRLHSCLQALTAGKPALNCGQADSLEQVEKQIKTVSQDYLYARKLKDLHRNELSAL